MCKYDLPKATSLKEPTQDSDPRSCLGPLPMCPKATSFLKTIITHMTEAKECMGVGSIKQSNKI
jgi:hypothetical protein